MRDKSNLKLVKGFWLQSSKVVKIFMVIGITLSIGTFLLANFSDGISDFLEGNLGPNFSLSEQPYGILFLLLFIIVGSAFSCLTSIHWIAFAWLSHRNDYNILATLFGILIFALDSYIRIDSVFFPTSSTSAIGVLSIPVFSVPILLIYRYITIKRMKGHITNR